VKRNKEKDGLITLIGGIKNGFAGQGNIAQIKFISKAGSWITSQAEIAISQNSLILDSTQKNVLGKTNSAIVSLISQSPTSQPTIEITPTIIPQVPPKSKITSIFLLIPVLIALGLSLYLFQKRRPPPISPPPPEPSPVGTPQL